MESGDGAGETFPALEDATNVLLLAPGAESQDRCLDALTTTPPAETHVLAVTYTSQPAAFVDAWTGAAGEQPASGGVVTVGQAETEFEHGTWRARTVESPGDLTGIGIESSDLLSDLADAADPEEEVTMCFDSVTVLLQHADLQRSFRFLHVVTGRVRNADARCYYHLDPAAHDEQAMATLTGLFDATVEYDGDGWALR